MKNIRQCGLPSIRYNLPTPPPRSGWSSTGIRELDSGGGWVDGCGLSAEEKAMLNARLAEYEKSPDAGSSLEELQTRIGQQLNQ